jgi:hypothetical protein
MTWNSTQLRPKWSESEMIWTLMIWTHKNKLDPTQLKMTLDLKKPTVFDSKPDSIGTKSIRTRLVTRKFFIVKLIWLVRAQIRPIRIQTRPVRRLPPLRIIILLSDPTSLSVLRLISIRRNSYFILTFCYYTKCQTKPLDILQVPHRYKYKICINKSSDQNAILGNNIV